MEILFVVLGGVILGLGVGAAVPRRELRGIALVPAIGGAAASIVWVALTWLGLAWNGGWIWVITFVIATLVAAIGGQLLSVSRERADIAKFVRLKSTPAV
jgi:hypothetical protein